MANTNLTIDMVTNKALAVLENALVVTRNVNRQYDKEFAVEGAKIGSTLRIRLPDRATVSTSAALTVEDITETNTTLTVSSRAQIAMSFTSQELALETDLDRFTELKIKPRMSQIAASVDYDVCNVYKDIYHSVGTPGTTPSTSLVLLQAQQKLDEMATARESRFCTINPAANAALVEGMKGQFNPNSTISGQFRTGVIAKEMYGFEEVAMSQSLPTHTTGAWGTTITSTGTLSTQGQATLPISFTGSSKTWKQGDVFTVASVYAVNPQTRVSTGSLQQFVVTADLTASSTGTLAIAPAIYTSGPLQTVDSFPQANAAVTMFGSASTAYPQNLVYHRDAIAFATADLILPKGTNMASRKEHNGMSVRIIEWYDGQNDRMPTRFDILYGYKAIRPVMACRIWG